MKDTDQKIAGMAEVVTDPEGETLVVRVRSLEKSLQSLTDRLRSYQSEQDESDQLTVARIVRLEQFTGVPEVDTVPVNTGIVTGTGRVR